MTTEERSGVEGVEGADGTGGQAASAGPGGAAILSLEQIEDEVGMLVRGGGDADRVLTQFMALRSALATAERRAEEAESMFRDYALAAQTIGFESSAAGIEDPDGTLVGIYRNTLTALASERAARERAERERDEAREEIARHPRRCTVDNKCEPCRSEERAWEQADAAEARAEKAESSLSRAVEALLALKKEASWLGASHPHLAHYYYINGATWDQIKAVLAEVGK